MNAQPLDNPVVAELDTARASLLHKEDKVSVGISRILTEARNKISVFYPAADESKYTPDLKNAVYLARALNDVAALQNARAVAS